MKKQNKKDPILALIKKEEQRQREMIANSF